ncbi:importin subunit alpha-1 [Blastocystis sp. subtype 4]|uniref:importin subunit alpha-1 n=1 Tax=Blastocystis sp. subtype 4 TaxID=944170 RepID=UPI0007122022|nr:importin subunit alpha-1 [Blastocystis sp. subtype 4]KNB42430.1 importin subunit alpha-1 [Blastocystis sp. subtype 4]|eukprot:XP_014525873.1 importin subunit alpha-1 [Blastocystis sp. subtype 4]
MFAIYYYSDHYPPIDLVIQTGLVPRFTSFLSCDSCPELQYEAAWVLTNIASGNKDQTAVVVMSGALPVLIGLINSPSSNVREQAAWALGNIAGDSADYRDAIIDAGTINMLLVHLNNNPTYMFQKNSVWLLSNLCRMRDGVPANFEKVSICLPYMMECLLSDKEEIVVDACWSFVFVTDSNKANTRYVLQMNVLPIVMQLLGNQNTKIVSPALRTVGNVLSGDDIQTQMCIDLNVLDYLEALINSSNTAIVKEATWCLSNIAAGNIEQIQLLLDRGLVPVLEEMINQGKLDIQKEACWTICNIVCGSSMNQLSFVLDKYRIVPEISMLLNKNSEEKLLIMIIDSLDRMMSVENMGQVLVNMGRWQTNIVDDDIQDGETLDNLEALSMTDEVYAKVAAFVDKYYEREKDEYALPAAQIDWIVCLISG